MFVTRMVIAAVVCWGSAATDANKVVISVYYDSLSNDTKLVFESQLRPVVDQSFDNVTLQLFPNGKTTYVYDQATKRYVFTCPNGEAECLSNMLQSCTLRPQDPDLSFNMHQVTRNKFNFLYCLVMHGRNVTDANVLDCARENDIDAGPIIKCAKGPDGNELQTVVRSSTKSVQDRYREQEVPLLIVNGRAANLSHARGLICENLAMSVCSAAATATVRLASLLCTLACTRILI